MQILIMMDPDITNLKWYYFGYFAVIRIQTWIFDAHADFDSDGAKYTKLTVKYHYVA